MIASATTPSATGFPGSRRSPNTMQHDRDDADDENEVLHLTELPGQQKGPFEKVVAPALHAKKAWQLGHGNRQAGAGLEAHENTVADQLYQHAQPQQPGEQAERRHREGGEAGDLRVTLHVSLSHGPHRSGNHERDGGSGPDGELTRGSEQGIAETAQQVAVDANLRRQACKAGIGKGNRDRVGRQGYPGDDIAEQPGSAVFSQPTGWRKPPKPDLSLSGVSSNPPCVPKPSPTLILNIGSASGVRLIHINACGLFDPKINTLRSASTETASRLKYCSPWI